MMNMIRADVYRITRGWGWWVTFLIAFALSAGIAVLGILDLDGASLGGQGAPAFIVTGANMLESMGYLGLVLMLFAAPVFSIVSSPIFQDKTEKNEVTWGISRTTLYVSRLIVSAVWCLLIMLVLFGTATVIATLYGGLGDVEAGFWMNRLTSFGAQWFMLVAAAWIGIFVTFAVKNPFVSFEIWGAIVALPTAMGMGAAMGGAGGRVPFIMYFDITTAMVAFSDLGALDTRRIAIGLAVGVFWAFVPTIVGLIRYQSKEIS
ncbi:MAG: hypothetical protein FWC16_10915 [Defluviitaleaceae bacterium]|nr:hypothetical protein [Defluviitaleaceae bacterium]MCL2275429.1 hypothetical protein [Defluviitaleaceae bacterium]